jgi:hypothetical protein
MITLANYLMKRRKWPYQGWHKRFFKLENGYITYGKSEQNVNIFFFFSFYIKPQVFFSSR